MIIKSVMTVNCIIIIGIYKLFQYGKWSVNVCCSRSHWETWNIMDIKWFINWKYFIGIYNVINRKHLIAKNVLCSVCRSCLIKLSTSLLFEKTTTLMCERNHEKISLFSFFCWNYTTLIRDKNEKKISLFSFFFF